MGKAIAAINAEVTGRGRYEYPFLTSWPDYKPDPNTAYGYEDVKVTPPIPSPAAIQRMEEVLAWLQLVPLEYRRLHWFRAEGWSWRKLGRYFGLSVIKTFGTCDPVSNGRIWLI